MSERDDLMREAAEQVHPIFVENEWTWWSMAGYYIPTVDQIEGMFRYLEGCLDGDDMIVSSGRLIVLRRNDGSSRSGVTLALDLGSEWDE